MCVQMFAWKRNFPNYCHPKIFPNPELLLRRRTRECVFNPIPPFGSASMTSGWMFVLRNSPDHAGSSKAHLGRGYCEHSMREAKFQMRTTTFVNPLGKGCGRQSHPLLLFQLRNPHPPLRRRETTSLASSLRKPWHRTCSCISARTRSYPEG